jgi:exodeoxyribonuclease V gamma subunit
MRGRSVAWRPVATPLLPLEQLLEYWWRGQSQPLRFFPRSSLAYADGCWSLDKAMKEWDGGFTSTGEGADPAYQRCFGEGYPFDGAFEAVARELLEPLLLHQEKV